MPLRIIAIAAMDQSRVIGKDNQIPWHIPEDQKRFSSLTRGHTVLMGRKTYDSLPARFKPLPDRKNIVVSRHPASLRGQSGIEVWDSVINFFAALKRFEVKLPTDLLWIIGGTEIYRESLRFWDEVQLTLVNGQHPGDAFFPEFEADFELKDKQDYQKFSFLHYVRAASGDKR